MSPDIYIFTSNSYSISNINSLVTADELIKYGNCSFNYLMCLEKFIIYNYKNIFE